MGQAIAQDHPVNRFAALGGPCLATFPNKFGINAGSADTARARVEMGQQIEIHKTIVERGDQGIGGGVGQMTEVTFAAGAIDDNHLGPLPERRERPLETLPLFGLGGVAVVGFAWPDAPMIGQRQIQVFRLDGRRPIGEVPAQAPLPSVEIDRRHPPALAQ